MKGFRERKHMFLLAVLVVAGVMQPLAVEWSERTRILAGIVTAVVSLGTLLVVFERRWQRRLALFMLVVLFGSNMAHETLWVPLQMGADPAAQRTHL